MPHDPQKVAAAFSRAAASYNSHARLQRIALTKCVGLLADRLPAESRVLDVGCGTGVLGQLVPRDHWNLTGIDMARDMCRQAAREMSVVNARVESLPFSGAAFHGAICSLVLQWVNEPRRALREMARVVKPGGYCGLAVLGPGTLWELKQAFAILDSHPHVNEFVSERQLDAMLAAEGFTIAVAQTERIALEYASVLHLMQELKSIGANQVPNRRRGLVTPSMIAQMEAGYPRHQQGIVATWEVSYRILDR